MQADLKQFFEPWELRVLELIEELKDSENVIKDIADEDTNCNDSKTNPSISIF